MVDLAVGEVLLPMRALLISSLIWLPVGTVPSHVAWQSTLAIGAKCLTSLRGKILFGLSCWMGNLWHILPRLLHEWMNYLLLQAKHGISRSLRLNAGMLHQELRMLVLELWTQNSHRCTIREWGFDKLTGLREAGLGVASGMLA
jgi:hypothetical protein